MRSLHEEIIDRVLNLEHTRRIDAAAVPGCEDTEHRLIEAGKYRGLPGVIDLYQFADHGHAAERAHADLIADDGVAIDALEIKKVQPGHDPRKCRVPTDVERSVGCVEPGKARARIQKCSADEYAAAGKRDARHCTVGRSDE